VASRSERDGDAGEDPFEESPKTEFLAGPLPEPRSRRDDVEFNELNVQLKISYKTLVLAFVLFDVFHKGINVLIDTDVVQGLLE